MAINKKITELTNLTVVSSGDLLPIVDVSEGDINERNKKVTIGTLTASLSINSPLTTKGDIYVRDNVGNGRLPIGTNAQILSVNSNTATGLEWITPEASEPVVNFATEQTTSFTLNDTFHGKFIPVNTNAGDVTITFDNSIRDGFQVILFHKGNTNQIILNANSQTLFSKGLTIQNNNVTATIIYDGATTTWYATGDLV